MVTLHCNPQLAETTCSNYISITSQKYEMELKQLQKRFEFFEKERIERERLEQEAARSNQDNLANEQPGTSKKPKLQ